MENGSINVMRIRKMIICVKLDHALYSINYGMHFIRLKGSAWARDSKVYIM